MTEPKDADALAKLLSSLTNLPASGSGDEFEEPSAEELAFLEAEMSGVEYDDDDDDFDDDDDEDDDMGGLEALLRAASQSAAPTGPECQTLSEIEEATRFLKILIDQQHLELEPGADLRTLATASSQYICGNANPELRAKELIGWLLKADGVYDVFCKDEIIVDLLAQW
jgi:hypothetical protein